MSDISRIVVLYGSQTFTAQEIAERIWRSLKLLGFRGPVQPMDDYPISRLIHEEYAIFVCATTGQGDEPDNMKKFWKFLLRKSLPANSLLRLKFGVLGLGDSTYAKFNFVGKKLHKRLIQLGATPLIDIGLCDYQHDLGHDAVMIPWLKQYYAILEQSHPDIQPDKLGSKFIPRWKVSLLKGEFKNNHSNNCIDDDIYYGKGTRDTYLNAILFEIEKNERTTNESHFQYVPGDIFNIRPRNSEEDVDDLFGIFETHNIDIKPHYRLLVEEFYEDMPVPEYLRTPLTMHDIASQFWDLKAYPTQYVFSLLALVSEDRLERDKCIELSTAEGQEDWLNYCRRPKRTILEVLHDFHKSAATLTIEILFELFSSIKPRSFSIASSCLPNSGQLDLIVAVVNYQTKLKKPRLGLTSNWLKNLNVGDRVFGWIKKGSIKFPTDLKTPSILIGPGTGIAPFRSLLQERDYRNTLDKDVIHLFFGCRYRNKDFHCKEELEKWERDGKVSLYCAFSRDQDNKVYVQHKIVENADLLWRLINSEKACIYISGNAKNMPDNVRDAFVDVFAKAGVSDARQMVKDLERDGRLQVEAW
ncbi:NADPH-dependent diflavin oxidoreductase 1 isoform X2 [Plodia interpunctella]|uniref:NADPH-dependent diflavin oxidoreductase 1 isoform X2 n=1 Tax=Plodia interpunctella TaxID=58824 RepID=UPI002367F7BC|nr:NADPH-dependent diflavin oxidoreductase 1 isoform X2 [Plodia interpunctella]